jgi:3-isopropylmalate/(R)-2-methylmalate dehydratase small subunit
VHRGIVVPLDRPDIDTDQIIPKQFLKRIERTGFGAYLFHDWATAPDGRPDPSFVLNEPRYRGASILVAGRNLGCGSSREHAAWALCDYGFRVLIAPSFARIFATNCCKNGLLTVELGESEVLELVRRSREPAAYRVTVDLERCIVDDGAGFSARFAIEEHRRTRLLEGIDDIDLTLQFESRISAYEQRRGGRMPSGWTR